MLALLSFTALAIPKVIAPLSEAGGDAMRHVITQAVDPVPQFGTPIAVRAGHQHGPLLISADTPERVGKRGGRWTWRVKLTLTNQGQRVRLAYGASATAGSEHYFVSGVRHGGHRVAKSVLVLPSHGSTTYWLVFQTSGNRAVSQVDLSVSPTVVHWVR